MKKILIPVDFSEHSEYALQVAATLAKKHGSKLVVLHMMGLSEAVLTKDESQEMFQAIYYMKLAEKRFNAFLEKDYLKGIDIQTTVQNYKEFHEIDKVARDFDADFIVMGSHGASGLKEVFVGSNTEKVVRYSALPVLVVKNKIKEFKMERVVFACDFNLDFIEPFKKAWKFFETTNTKFQIVFINLPDKYLSTQEMEERAFQFILRTGLDTSLMNDIVYYCDYNFENGIYSFSNKVDADLIIVPTHGRRGLAHFFSENLGESLMNHSDIPIMTFKV
ncbi:nucleotide-binding universal stress UspA family protein [Ulvibacter sp. MAR_2010_11]|uniref:universal stress protein n=1 Tax=Ulvibacter sp. MAR_2010_11 TaxID=1250229 RepID=UPI000C2BB609|nr:universal stress protein [Ulvibacter sp. MAR_2010_11]PKA84500.1 nucleotide-binding universal stress UspA family protein [Ulvibacter sp. MAR_2010_11]